MEELLKELQIDLEVELSAELHSDADKTLLSSKIKGAYREVKLRRNYQEHHTQEYVDRDMEKLYPVIKYLALYDWNMIGAEGQESHSENGVLRGFVKRNEILAKVIPFAQVL